MWRCNGGWVHVMAAVIVSTMSYPYSWAPGSIDPSCTMEEACRVGYTSTVRPGVSYTNKLKKSQILEHDVDCSGGCEEDHVISLELCGSPGDILNLSPEPYWPKPGAREKDQAEDYLHRQVCQGKMTLEEAQKEITTDWLSIYNNLQKTKKKK